MSIFNIIQVILAGTLAIQDWRWRSVSAWVYLGYLLILFAQGYEKDFIGIMPSLIATAGILVVSFIMKKPIIAGADLGLLVSAGTSCSLFQFSILCCCVGGMGIGYYFLRNYSRYFKSQAETIPFMTIFISAYYLVQFQS